MHGSVPFPTIFDKTIELKKRVLRIENKNRPFISPE